LHDEVVVINDLSVLNLGSSGKRVLICLAAPSMDNGVEEECPLSIIQAINNRKTENQM